MGARIGCMSKVNGEMAVDRDRLIWELLASPCLEHASECGGQEGRQRTGIWKKNQENIGRKLVGGSSSVAGVAV